MQRIYPFMQASSDFFSYDSFLDDLNTRQELSQYAAYTSELNQPVKSFEYYLYLNEQQKQIQFIYASPQFIQDK